MPTKKTPAYEYAHTCSGCLYGVFGTPNRDYGFGKKQMGVCYLATGLPPEKPKLGIKGYLPNPLGRYASEDIRDLPEWMTMWRKADKSGFPDSRRQYPSLKEYQKLVVKAAELGVKYYKAEVSKIESHPEHTDWARRSRKSLKDADEALLNAAVVAETYYMECDEYIRWWDVNWPKARLAHRNVCCAGYAQAPGQRDSYAKSIVNGTRTLHGKEK